MERNGCAALPMTAVVLCSNWRGFFFAYWDDPMGLGSRRVFANLVFLEARCLLDGAGLVVALAACQQRGRWRRPSERHRHIPGRSNE